MPPQPRGVFFSQGVGGLPPVPPPTVSDWMTQVGAPTISLMSVDELVGMALRGRPHYVILDARHVPQAAADACARLKNDPYTAIVPVVVLSADSDEAYGKAFGCHPDEVVRESMSAMEMAERLNLMLTRSTRDTQVHPSTRLPGTIAIESEIAKRIQAGGKFAVCYADLDHFKEFNDRYSYVEGDRVIRVLANLLHDVVRGVCPDTGFVGHIGGDDFIFIVPLDVVDECCTEIVTNFDLIIRYQYSDQDRRAGYFFGKDRRGQLHRVPLMTLSIGVVTNNHREFVVAREVSQLATEMKSYAKTLPGSVYTVDRRIDSRPTPPEPWRAVQEDKVVVENNGGHDGGSHEG